MYASNYLETAIINLMRRTALSAPSNLYVGLFLGNPTDSGSAAEEVVYSGYQRQAVNFSLDESSYSIYNSAQITFPESTTTLGQNVTHIGIYDAVTGTPATSASIHMWLYGELVTPLAIQTNVSPVFRPNSIRWTMNGNISDYYKRNILNVIRHQTATLSGFSPFIGLCKYDPNTDGNAEFSGNAYERIGGTNGVDFTQPSTDSQSAMATTTSNSADIASPNPATGYWGNLTYAGIYTAKTGGQLFASVPLGGNSYNMNEGSVAGFRAGQLTFSVN